MPAFSLDSFASVGVNTPKTAPVSPAMSRSNSAASNFSQASHQSAPARHSVPQSTTGNRSTSVTSTQSHPAPKTNSHGLKHFFSAEGKAERKEKKRLEDERISKILITSKHTAMVKTRMMMEQQQRRSSTGRTASVVGTTSSAHMTAAQQEARLPHSGPPALHSPHRLVDRDMPLLDRIASCDERDEEDEKARQHRDDWILKKADVATLHRVREASDASEEGVTEVLHGRVVEPGEDSITDRGVFDSKQSKSKRGFGAWSRNDAGVWTR